MRSCVFGVIPCILAFVSPQVLADHKTLTTNNTLSSLTKSYKTPPTRTIASHNAIKSQTSGEKTRLRSSHSATKSPTKSHKTPPKHSATRTKSHKTHMTVSKSSEEVPTRSNRATGFQTRSRSSMARKATTEFPPAKTATNSTIPQTPLITPVVTASKTLTIRNGQTASAQVGWLVVGVGIGGSVSVGGHILPVAGGTEAIIGENGSGQDELSTINTSTTSSSASLTSSSTSSSSSSSSSASPTPYNIYPRLGSTPSQQSAFARDLEQIARPGSVRSIAGQQLLLWVASLTPAQASEVQRNPVVSVPL